MSEKRVKHHQGQNASTNFDDTAMQSRHLTVNSLTVCRDMYGPKNNQGVGMGLGSSLPSFPPYFSLGLTRVKTTEACV